MLRPDLATCLARAEERSTEPSRVPGHPPLAASGPITLMWQRFSDLGGHEAHVVDNTALEPVDTVDELLQRKAAGKLRTEQKP